MFTFIMEFILELWFLKENVTFMCLCACVCACVCDLGLTSVQSIFLPYSQQSLWNEALPASMILYPQTGVTVLIWGLSLACQSEYKNFVPLGSHQTSFHVWKMSVMPSPSAFIPGGDRGRFFHFQLFICPFFPFLSFIWADDFEDLQWLGVCGATSSSGSGEADL